MSVIKKGCVLIKINDKKTRLYTENYAKALKLYHLCLRCCGSLLVKVSLLIMNILLELIANIIGNEREKKIIDTPENWLSIFSWLLLMMKYQKLKPQKKTKMLF